MFAFFFAFLSVALAQTACTSCTFASKEWCKTTSTCYDYISSFSVTCSTWISSSTNCPYSCPVGKYNYNAGTTSSACLACGVNTYSALLSGATSCSPCPSGYTSPQGSFSSSACTLSSASCPEGSSEPYSPVIDTSSCVSMPTKRVVRIQ